MSLPPPMLLAVIDIPELLDLRIDVDSSPSNFAKHHIKLLTAVSDQYLLELLFDYFQNATFKRHNLTSSVVYQI